MAMNMNIVYPSSPEGIQFWYPSTTGVAHRQGDPALSGCDCALCSAGPKLRALNTREHHRARVSSKKGRVTSTATATPPRFPAKFPTKSAPTAATTTFPRATFSSFGNMLQAVVAADTGRGVDARLYAAAIGMGENVPSDGGFLVAPKLADQIWLKSTEEGEILRRCTRFPTTSGSGIKIPTIDETSRADGSRFGGLQFTWLDEGSSITTSTPRFGLSDLRFAKCAALVYTTDELLADSAMLESVIMSILPSEYTNKLEAAIVDGTGAGQPMGILRADARVTVAKEGGQAANTIVWANIRKMWSRLWTRSKRGDLSTRSTAWLIDQTAETELLSMSETVGTGGVPVYLPANVAAGQSYPSLMGRPVIPIEFGKPLGTEGDLILADLSQYLLSDKPPRTDLSMQVNFAQDEGAFRFVFFADGMPGWTAPITPASGGSSQSPIVTLATRA